MRTSARRRHLWMTISEVGGAAGARVELRQTAVELPPGLRSSASSYTSSRSAPPTSCRSTACSVSLANCIVHPVLVRLARRFHLHLQFRLFGGRLTPRALDVPPCINASVIRLAAGRCRSSHTRAWEQGRAIGRERATPSSATRRVVRAHSSQSESSLQAAQSSCRARLGCFAGALPVDDDARAMASAARRSWPLAARVTAAAGAVRLAVASSVQALVEGRLPLCPMF